MEVQKDLKGSDSLRTSIACIGCFFKSNCNAQNLYHAKTGTKPISIRSSIQLEMAPKRFCIFKTKTCIKHQRKHENLHDTKVFDLILNKKP